MRSEKEIQRAINIAQVAAFNAMEAGVNCDKEAVIYMALQWVIGSTEGGKRSPQKHRSGARSKDERRSA